jgi:hypothetical protein
VTAISSYLFFWQSRHRVEDRRAEDLGGKDAVALPDRDDAGAARKLRNDLTGVVGRVVIAAFVDNPIGLLVFSAVVNGIAAAPFLIVTMLISGKEPENHGPLH